MNSESGGGQVRMVIQLRFTHASSATARKQALCVTAQDARWERNVRSWLDEKQMSPGNDIYEQVDRGIGLLCCSRRWWVDDETDRAFAKERELMKEPKQKV